MDNMLPSYSNQQVQFRKMSCESQLSLIHFDENESDQTPTPPYPDNTDDDNQYLEEQEEEEDDDSFLEVEDSFMNDQQDSSEEQEEEVIDDEYRDMPQLSPIKLSPSYDFDMNSSSPIMPVLSPMCEILEEEEEERSSMDDFNLKENANLTDGMEQETNSSSSSSSEMSIVKKATKAPSKKKLRYPTTPPSGQISLRGYYYGRWNWGEDLNNRVTSTNKKKQKKKGNFEAEFYKQEWRAEMMTPVLCPSCPAEILKNRDIVAHIMEHVMVGDSGNLELVKFEGVPKLASVNSQCRLCFSKCANLLNSHMRKKHQHIADICCQICEIAFKSVDAMSVHHSKYHHVAEMPFCCPVCDCRSSVRWDIIQHFQLKHGKDQNAMCPFCMKLFIVSISEGMLLLQNHLLAHKAEPEINCPRCCLKFVDKDDLDVHLVYQHHPPEEMQGDAFYDPTTGFQCFKEEDKRRPIFIAHPKRIIMLDTKQ